jgi:hypothetical protein
MPPAAWIRVKIGKLLVYGAVFVYPGRKEGLYDSQATNCSALQGGESSHRVLPVFCWSLGSHTYDS